MRQNINHVDSVIWVSHHEALKANVQRLEQLANCKFSGPYLNEALGAHIYTCNSAGMHVMAPVRSSSARMARALSTRLEAHGEGVFGVIYNVLDLSIAKAQIAKSGYEATDLDIATGHEPWAAEVRTMRCALVCQAMNTTFIYAEAEYSDNVISLEGGSPATTRYNNRVDHVAWVCFPKNYDRNIEFLSKLGGIPLDGPHDKPEQGIRIAISWETGLEVISPIEGSKGVAAIGANQLLERGEGIYGVLFGVADMDAALERASAAGYTPGNLIRGGLDPHAPWAGKYKTFLESNITKVMNTDFMYCFVEYPKDIFCRPSSHGDPRG